MDKESLGYVKQVAAFGKLVEPALLVRAGKASGASPAAGAALYFLGHAVGAALDIAGAIIEIVKQGEDGGGDNAGNR